MAAIANDKDKILQAAAVRLPESPGNYIYFSNVSPVFKVTTGGTATPANYAVEAKFSGQLRGTVSWSVVSGTVSAAGQSGNTWNISAGDLTTNTAVIRATLVYLGTTYTNQFTISKVFDGVAGTNGITATLVRLTGSEIVFIKFKDGSYSSNSVNIFANTQNIPNPVFTWNDGINPPVVKDSTLIAGANQFQFNRPAELGVYTISVSVKDKNNLALGTAVDSTSIAFIEEGSDAFTFAFKELADQFSANSLGVLEGGVTSALNHIIGIKGIALLVPGVDIVYSVHSTENCTATLGAVTGTWNQQFTVSGAFFTQASVTTAKVTIKCQVPGSVFYLMTASYVKVRKGDTGITGTNTATIALYAKNTSSSAPPAAFSGTFTYTFSTSVLSGGTLNGWSTTAPNLSNGEYLWVRYAVAASNTATDSISAGEFSGAVVSSVGGVNGTNTATIELFAKNTSASTPPAAFSGTFTYTFSTSALTGGTLNGWSRTAPAITNGEYLWARYAVAASNTATDAVDATEFSAAVVRSIGGTNGAPGTNGTNGTNGVNAVKSTSGYIYYAFAGGDPGTPSASSFNFSAGTFTGLSSGWGTTVNMTGNGSYWAARYVVTESAFGSNTGTPTFSNTFNHQNFEGLVTFTDQTNTLSNYATQTYAINQADAYASSYANAVRNGLAVQNYTAIHGGNISTGTLTADRIQAGSSNTSNNTQFAFGTGSVLAGIATVGFFKSQNSSILGLGVLSSSNIAFAASTTFNGSAGGFGNRSGSGIDDIASGNNRTLASFTSPTMAAFIQKRSQGGTANIMQQDGNTQAFVKIAFNEGSGDFALQALNYTTNYYTNLGTPSHALYTNGPIGPFTGSHDGLLDKSVTPMPGDIMVDLSIIASKGVSDSIATIELSSRINQAGPVGIYVGTSSQIPVPLMITVEEATQGMDGGPSTTTVQKLNPIYQSLVETHNYVIINSIGEGSINVCGEGGTIELGDLIVTSSVPGKGMRQSDDIVRSVTVAKARETVTFDSPTQVKQIACIYMCG
jgi:hypothetical protein